MNYAPPVGASKAGSRSIETVTMQFNLTPLEKQMTASLVTGYTTKETARIAGIGQPTVRKNLRDIIAKLGVSNR